MEARTFQIAEHSVGAGSPTFIIAEVALAHDGSLGAAHAYINAAARAGADAVKFQTHIASAESTPAEKFRVQFSLQDASRYEYWNRTAFTADQWLGLARHAIDKGLVFLSSPFSNEAVDLLERVGMPAWKIGSGEVTNWPLLERVAATRKPILLSTGLVTFGELDDAVSLIRRAGAPLGVFQCTSAYPCPAAEIGLEQIPLLKERYTCPAGLSDHSGTIYAGIAAAALGADMLEVHITFSRDSFGPDVSASVTTNELAQLVQGVRFVDEALATPVDKSVLNEHATSLRALFTKSVTARVHIPAGTVLAQEHLTVKKPGTGIPAAAMTTVIGRRLNRDVEPDTLLLPQDLD